MRVRIGGFRRCELIPSGGCHSRQFPDFKELFRPDVHALRRTRRADRTGVRSYHRSVWSDPDSLGPLEARGRRQDARDCICHSGRCLRVPEPPVPNGGDRRRCSLPGPSIRSRLGWLEGRCRFPDRRRFVGRCRLYRHERRRARQRANCRGRQDWSEPCDGRCLQGRHRDGRTGRGPGLDRCGGLLRRTPSRRLRPE